MFAGIVGSWEILLIFFLILPLMLASFAFWVWMLVDCIRNLRLTDNQRIVWVIVIALTHCLGALIYLLAGRNPRNA